MTGIEYLIAPALGGVIGYITNDLAIRMLFRPHTAKYIGKWRIPFTPGLIPKERNRIADSIGSAISDNLMSADVLQRYLLSDEMTTKVRSAAEDFFAKLRGNEETLEAFLCHYLNKEELNGMVKSVEEDLTAQIQTKLQDPQLGAQIAHLAMDHMTHKMDGQAGEELASGLGGTMKLFGSSIVTKILGLLREPLERYLTNTINGVLQNEGGNMVRGMIADETFNLLTTSMATLLKGKEEQTAKVVSSIEKIYVTIIRDNLGQMLASLDISKIVRDRINEMDVAETERLIFSIMNKELKAIVWLGAILGFLMGSINCLIF